MNYYLVTFVIDELIFASDVPNSLIVICLLQMENILLLHPKMAIFMSMQFMMMGQHTEEWAAVQ